MHDRNGREYRLPTIPRLSVNGFCKETKSVYEFLAVIGKGILVYRIVTKRKVLVSRSPCVMNRPRPDWNISRRQGNKSKCSGNVNSIRGS